jgi:hypothetical protein
LVVQSAQNWHRQAANSAQKLIFQLLVTPGGNCSCNPLVKRRPSFPIWMHAPESYQGVPKPKSGLVDLHLVGGLENAVDLSPVGSKKLKQ